MTYGGYGRVEDHTGAYPTHHLTHTLPHLGLVTMYRTSLARRLLIAKLTPVQSTFGIYAQSLILLGDIVQFQSLTTIYIYHQSYHPLLALYSSHLCIMVKTSHIKKGLTEHRSTSPKYPK